MRDTIYRDDAIEAVCGVVIDAFDVSPTRGYEVSEKALSSLPSAEPSLKAIKRQIDEHWYLDAPSAENSNAKAQNSNQETQNSNGDLIYRADAIDALEANKSDWDNDYNRPIEKDIQSLKALPSAEAEEYEGYEHATLVDIKEPLRASAETSQNLAKPNKELKGSDLISRDVVLANIDERLRANGYVNVGLVSELNRLFGYVRNIPSAEAVQRGW